MESAVLTDNVVEFNNADVSCQFCKRLGEDVQVEEWHKKIDTHLVVTISGYGTKDEHCHLHGCVDNAQAMLKIMGYIKNEIDKRSENIVK